MTAAMFLWCAAAIAALGAVGVGVFADGLESRDPRGMATGALVFVLAIAGIPMVRH